MLAIAAASDRHAGHLLLGQPELVDELPEGAGLVERVEVGALEVLDQRPGQLGCSSASGRRAGMVAAGDLRGAQATLAGDEPIARRRLGHQDRLEHAVFGDARGERLELLLVDGRRGW